MNNKSVKNSTSPIFYYLRSPIKKSSKKDLNPDIGDTKDLCINSERKKNTIPSKANAEHSFVDMILLEESYRSKHSKTGES